MKGGKSSDLDKKSAKNLIKQSFVLAGVQFIEPALRYLAMECNTCTKDMAMLSIRDAVESGNYHCIYEQPDGQAVADAVGLKLENPNDMMEFLSDPDSLDYMQIAGDEVVAFIDNETDGDISFAVSFEYDFKNRKTTIRIAGDMPDMNEDKEILKDFSK